MEKDKLKAKKMKLKSGEFLLYCVDGLNYINNKLDTDYIIDEHVKYSQLSDEEREFYYEYERNTDNLKIEYFNESQSLTLEEMNEKFNSAVIKQFEKARYEEILQKMNSKQIGKQQNIALHHKFNYLIHLFCSKCTNNEDGHTKISSELLKKTIGNEYNIALYTLLNIGFIDTDGSYTIGKSSRMFHLKDKYISSIKTKSEDNPKIKKYIDKSFKEIEAYKKARFKRLSDRDKFVIERYNNDLSRLKMTLIEECEDFIHNNREYDIKKPIQKEYYKNIYNQYAYQENGLFQIITVDNNSRIYHILTSTPKDLRKYLNIKYTIDIKNSHPLLLNKLLLIYYYNRDLFNNILNKKIEYFKYIDIYNILTSNINTYNHYVSDNLHNDLKYNNIDELLLDASNIPADVKKYIKKASRGEMWEELLNACEENGLKADDRSELKAKMFAEVFYSKTRTTIYKDFGKVFKSIYPNVYQVINELKPNEQETKLSHILMRVESELFYQILERIYRQTEYEAINIHDAIIILDTTKNESCTINDIEPIMRDVYNAYNLFPTFSNEWHSTS